MGFVIMDFIKARPTIQPPSVLSVCPLRPVSPDMDANSKYAMRSK